jgi:hypothetical protein
LRGAVLAALKSWKILEKMLTAFLIDALELGEVISGSVAR